MTVVCSPRTYCERCRRWSGVDGRSETVITWTTDTEVGWSLLGAATPVVCLTPRGDPFLTQAVVVNLEVINESTVEVVGLRSGAPYPVEAPIGVLTTLAARSRYA